MRLLWLRAELHMTCGNINLLKKSTSGYTVNAQRGLCFVAWCSLNDIVIIRLT